MLLIFNFMFSRLDEKSSHFADFLNSLSRRVLRRFAMVFRCFYHIATISLNMIPRKWKIVLSCLIFTLKAKSWRALKWLLRSAMKSFLRESKNWRKKVFFSFISHFSPAAVFKRDFQIVGTIKTKRLVQQILCAKTLPLSLFVSSADAFNKLYTKHSEVIVHVIWWLCVS